MKTFVTLILIICTLVLAGFSLVQIGRIDVLSQLTGSPAKEANTPLFEQDLRTTAHIRIQQHGRPDMEFTFDPKTGLWNGTQPWNDRADGPKAIEQLVRFAMMAEIQDSLPANSQDLDTLGLGKKAIHIELKDSQNNLLTSFSIGKSSAWKKKIEGKDDEEDTLVPTVYLRLQDSDANDHVYLCSDYSGDIHALFAEKGKAFRDHRPFALNIHDLKQVRLVRDRTEIVLSHADSVAAWKLTKPLELDTDREALMKFLSNLSKIQAISLHKTDAISLPENPESTFEIGVTSFSSDQEILLKVYPPRKGTGTCYATVSNRNVVFELPLIATPKASNYITQLPQSINQLRSRKMLELDKAARVDLRSIIIRTPQSSAEPVIVARTPKEPYKLLTQRNGLENIDEILLGDFLKSITTTPVKDFASDAATDFSPFGLDQPAIVIDFLFFKGSPTQLRIGKVASTTKDGLAEDLYYANLRGTPIVWQIAPELVTDIPTRYWEWQPKEIWSLSVIDIIQFTAQQTGKDKLTVNYDYLDDSFTATLGDKDMSEQLISQRAKYFLNENHVLTAQARLSPHHKAAAAALETPVFTSTITVQNFDDEGLPIAQSTYTLKLAKPSQSGRNAFYYAQASNIEGYFILDLATVRKLAALDLFDDE